MHDTGIFTFHLSSGGFCGASFSRRGRAACHGGRSNRLPPEGLDKKTEVDGYAGEGHLEFTGNTITSGPPRSPLEYHFQIEKPGTYALLLRARKRLETERHDLSNDCYVRVEGVYQSGGEVPLEILQEDAKLFGGSPDRWGWAGTLDVKHKKYKPRYAFQAGQQYTLIVSGRSKNFNFDRIYFVHEDEDLASVKGKMIPQSALKDSLAAQKPRRTKRLLTNQKGVQLEAVLLKKEGDLLSVLIGGKPYQIPLSTLSAEDQLFLEGWQP